MRKRIVAANWKMNLLPLEAESLFNALIDQQDWKENATVIIFPPAIYLSQFAKNQKRNFKLGIQNFYPEINGAFTGEISVTQAIAAGAEYALIGHSERRAYFGEDASFLKKKVDTALEHNLHPVFCCGEPLVIREANKEIEFVKQQLEESLFHLNSSEIVKICIAYEPVWAIGTGKTATVDQAEEMHRSIRSWLSDKYSSEIANQISILYGGSCSPDNAYELFACPNVDGGLIGGASLKVDSFIKIIEAI